jgi:hypothetical protein
MRKTILGSLKRRSLSAALLVAVGVLGFSAVAAADTLGSIDFESAQGYVAGNIHGQNGWSKLGAYDVEVEQTDRFGFGQALRISNAVTTGAFGDQASRRVSPSRPGSRPGSTSRRASTSQQNRTVCRRASRSRPLRQRERRPAQRSGPRAALRTPSL